MTMRIWKSVRRAAARFLRGESGATALEYAVLAGFVMLACAAAVAAFKAPAGSHLSNVGTSIGTYADP
jgi:Flp pilus assembly pilin Flp